MAECLHCEINKVVDEYIATGPQPADLGRNGGDDGAKPR